jgi:MFS family permease
LTGLRRYGAVLRAPHVRHLYLTSLVARLPIGINGLAIVLFMREHTGSFAAAGAATGGYALALGVSAPIEGRLIDRHSPRAVLPWVAGLQVVSVLAFIALGLAGAPVAVLVALAAAAGLGGPPWSSVMRAMWPRLLDGDQRLVDTAFALDAAVVELVFIAGPLLTGAVTALFSPQVALLVSVAAISVGTALFVASPAVGSWEPETHADRNPLGALRVPGLRTVVLATVPIGFALGALEIAVPAFAAHHGSASTAGVLVAIWSCGSAIGGVSYGARDWTLSLGTRWIVLNALLAAGMLPLLVAQSVPAILPLLLLAGLFIAPTIGSGSQLLGTLAPPGMGTEAFAWGTSAIVAGAAAGSAVAGALAESSGWRAAAASALVMAALGALLAAGRRRTLAPV